MLATPAAIFQRAQETWIERALPPYESFHIACDKTFLAQQCASGEVIEFVVRWSDGRTFAQSVATDAAPSRTLMRGGYITGPDGTPLGFYRTLPESPGGAVTQPPPNLAPDPLLQTIATTTVVDRAYDIAFAGTEHIDATTCDRLTFRPLRDPERFALRALWVDEASGNVVRLTYAHDYGNGVWGTVDYWFAPRGAARVWTIVEIDADAPPGSAYGSSEERVSSSLDDIDFPASMPDADFEP